MNMQEQTAPLASPERSAEILDLIRSVFAEKGFDGASMQDLARAAGMSVGNFYRYFPSKDAIIAAMAAFDMAELEADFAEVRTAADPIALIREKIRYKIGDGCGESGRLWAEIATAAQRKPEIARISCAVEDFAATNLLTIFGGLLGLSPDQAEARFGPQMRFIIMLVKTAAMRRAAQFDPGVEALVLKTIDDTIYDIISAARE